MGEVTITLVGPDEEELSRLDVRQTDKDLVLFSLSFSLSPFLSLTLWEP
jgi:hypothetical protein